MEPFTEYVNINKNLNDMTISPPTFMTFNNHSNNMKEQCTQTTTTNIEMKQIDEWF